MKGKLKETPVISVLSIEDQDSGYGEYGEAEIERAARILMEAEEIKADKAKMKYVSECLKRKAKEMSSVISSLDELRSKAKEKINEEDGDDE